DLLGYAREEYVGRHVAEFHVDRDAVDDMLVRLHRGEALRGHRVRLRHRDGSIRHCAIDCDVFRRDHELVHTRWFTRDTTDLVHNELAGAELASIVQSSHDPIVGKTLDGIVTSWNEAAERLFGYSSDEMVGQPISRIIPPELHADYHQILDTLRRGERIRHFEAERVCKDGRRIHVELSVSPIRDATGCVVGASKIARDITGRKRVEEERRRLLQDAEHARAEAEAASRAKDEFLAMLSHELRNPLAAIRSA